MNGVVGAGVGHVSRLQRWNSISTVTHGDAVGYPVARRRRSDGTGLFRRRAFRKPVQKVQRRGWRSGRLLGGNQFRTGLVRRAHVGEPAEQIAVGAYLIHLHLPICEDR